MKLFFDTMIYLQYRSIEELDIAKIFGPYPHTILIPRITIRELDKHKNGESNRLKKRAERVLKQIKRWTSGNTIRPGLTAEYWPTLPQVDFGSLGLNPDWNDDLLIASILQYKSEYPNEIVTLVTQDSGPALTASHLDISVQDFPEEWKLPAEENSLEKENRELIKKIATIENAFPKLVISFEDTPRLSNKKFKLPPRPPTDRFQIDRIINSIRKKWPEQSPPKKGNNSQLPHWVTLNSLNSIDAIAPGEYERYNRDITRYLNEYEQYLVNLCDSEESEFRKISFQIVIENIGNSPAEDLDIRLHFPNGLRLFEEDDLPPLPEQPQPPTKPRTAIDILMQSSRFPTDIYRIISKENSHLKLSSSSINGVNNYEDNFGKIKHGDKIFLPRLVIIFDSFESATSLSCQYSLRPANLPQAIKGDMHFVIE